MYFYDFEVQSFFSGRVIHLENLSLHDSRENLIRLCELCGVDQSFMYRRVVYIEVLRIYMCNNLLLLILFLIEGGLMSDNFEYSKEYCDELDKFLHQPLITVLLFIILIFNLLYLLYLKLKSLWCYDV